jgi:phage terminase small subunit
MRETSDPDPDPDPARKLRAKPRRFLQEYLIDLNPTEAALRASYGPERRKARAMANYFLRRPDFKAALAHAMAARARRTEISADRVIEEYARIAFADISRFATWGPEGVSLRPQTHLSADDLAAVAEISRPGAKNSARLKLFDKRAALAALARHLGLFPAGDGRGGWHPPLPPGTDMRTPAQERARATLRKLVAQVVAEREPEGAGIGAGPDRTEPAANPPGKDRSSE